MMTRVGVVWREIAKEQRAKLQGLEALKFWLPDMLPQ
jgi:hypothetical protein